MTVDDAARADLPDVPVVFLSTPRHPILQQRYDHWLIRRGARLVPARANFNRADIKPLLPDVIIRKPRCVSGRLSRSQRVEISR
jgi:hypothetical protein